MLPIQAVPVARNPAALANAEASVGRHHVTISCLAANRSEDLTATTAFHPGEARDGWKHLAASATAAALIQRHFRPRFMGAAYGSQNTRARTDFARSGMEGLAALAFAGAWVAGSDRTFCSFATGRVQFPSTHA